MIVPLLVSGFCVYSEQGMQDFLYVRLHFFPSLSNTVDWTLISVGRPKFESFRKMISGTRASIRSIRSIKCPSTRVSYPTCILGSSVDMSRTTGSDIAHRDITGWSATEYRRVAPYVFAPEATAPILSSLGASPGDKVLDLGCGSGEVTAEIARLVRPDGIVVGVDSSEDMVNHYLLLTSVRMLTVSHRLRGPARQRCFQIRTSS
jgi:hypothetical protein